MMTPKAIDSRPLTTSHHSFSMTFAYHRSFHVGRQSDRVVQSFDDFLVVVVTAIDYSMHD
jgi:hypothetical protein